MYLWKIKTIIANPDTGATNKIRHVILNSNRAEDAYERARSMDLGTDESLREAELLGSIPSVTESTQYVKPLVYYLVASYMYPDSTLNQSVRRVPTGFNDRIDVTLAKKLGVDVPVGPIATDGSAPVDTSKIGLFVAMPAEDVEQARLLVSAQVFWGDVKEDDIYILQMMRIPIPQS